MLASCLFFLPQVTAKEINFLQILFAIKSCLRISVCSKICELSTLQHYKTGKWTKDKKYSLQLNRQQQQKFDDNFQQTRDNFTQVSILRDGQKQAACIYSDHTTTERVPEHNRPLMMFRIYKMNFFFYSTSVNYLMQIYPS